MKKTIKTIVSMCAASLIIFSACSGGTNNVGTSSSSNSGSDETSAGSETTTTSGTSSGTSSTPTTTSTTKKIKFSDVPTGYAGVSYSATPTSYTVSTVTTREELISKAKLGNQIIYVSGMIDMTNDASKSYGSLLPTAGGGTSTGLDAFVAAQSTSTSYANYNAWRNAYVRACTTSTDNGSSHKNDVLNGDTWTLDTAYKNIVQIDVASNTIIIGLDENSGIKGGSINIGKSGETRSNIVIRNLTIQDAYDPFPHHESGDGYNAERDYVVIQQTTSNIWIDHCTFKETMSLIHVYTGASSDAGVLSGGSGTDEKWQTYDGMLDIKGTANGATVSYCKFMNHDKTLLFCSGSSDTGTKNITLDHNYFYGTKQRLPMVGHANLHTYNNYVAVGNGTYTNDYAIGLRYAAKVVSENNCFSNFVKYSYKNQGSLTGELYKSGDSDSSTDGVQSDATLSSCIKAVMPFTPSYTYTPEEAAGLSTSIPANAGAGKWAVEQ